MENLIILGLAAAVLLTAVASIIPNRPQPPQILYVQPTPVEPSGTGCLPLVVLVAVIVAAIAFA